MILEFSSKKKYSDVKFSENPSIASRVLRADGWYMPKLIVAFLQISERTSKSKGNQTTIGAYQIFIYSPTDAPVSFLKKKQY